MKKDENVSNLIQKYTISSSNDCVLYVTKLTGYIIVLELTYTHSTTNGGEHHDYTFQVL